MKDKDFNTELSELSPLLVKWPKGLPPAAPEGYLESLDSIIMEQVSIDSLYQNKDNFSDLPFEYFDGLDEKIMGRIREDQKPVVKQLHISERIHKVVSLAIRYKSQFAAIFTFIVGSVLIFNLVPGKKEVNTEIVMEDAYLEYLKKNLDDIDLKMMINTETITDGILSNMNVHNTNDSEFEKLVSDRRE
ncbi:MAG: hypothetical protein IPM42_11515 [Saprospiraceae bacterium]|nr:hypothetical protein [Saprospiraceae bacterium]